MGTLALLAVTATKGPLDTWSPTLIAAIALFLPLAALVIILAFTIDSKRVSAGTAVLFTFAAVVCAQLVTAIEIAHPLHLERNANYVQFFTGQSGLNEQFLMNWGVVADSLSAIGLTIVTVVSLLVQIFAFSFMRREEGFVRFFAFLLAGTFVMEAIVLSTNYFQMFMFFQLLGLAAYLLIGHFWKLPEAAAAARRAVVVNAVGDVGLLLATIYIYFRFNDLSFANLDAVYTRGKVGHLGLFVMAALVFVAAIAKTAQLPLQIWVSDLRRAPAPAMAFLEGGALSVAGVYLVARTYGLFHARPESLAMLCIVGGLSALAAAVLALGTDNLLRLISYSTMSQAGLMFLAMGLGAYGGSIYLLFTHAWWKALLLLVAGVVVIQLRSELMSEMGGLFRRMRLSGVMALIACASGAAIPPLSVYWALQTALARPIQIGSWLGAIVMVLVALLTSLYLFRMFFRVFLGQTARRRRFDPERIRDTGGRQAFAMALFAFAAIVAGALSLPGPKVKQGLTGFVNYHALSASPSSSANTVALILAAAAGLLGLALAYVFYSRGMARRFAISPQVRQTFEEGFYAEPAYRRLLAFSLFPVGTAVGWVERRVLDRGGHEVGESLAAAEWPERWTPRPRTSAYGAAIAGGLVLIALLAFLFSHGLSRLTLTP